jgi:hypothetical protein
MEEYNPKKYPEHLQVKKKYKDKLDGKTYIEEVIEWHVCRVCSLNAVPAVQYVYPNNRKTAAHSLTGSICSNPRRVFVAYGV